ncbi:sigma-70 family RNA polymerase sigma factor [Paenibacillus sp. GCM10012307]|uniref:Sigma-70 family RNA polymerase sigma factor n=1 Tax=Paenibacillus roseus TaxID=2798579 RepID=A0A934J9V2_9BACL|nr:sigma-70 family RNA polymerase sigma factor [Paenibacillus roseus]
MSKFDGAYVRYKHVLIAISRRFSSSTKVPFEDYFSALTECLWRCVEEFIDKPIATFETYLTTSLKREAINLSKSRYARFYAIVNFEQYSSNKDDEDAPTSEIADEVIIENEVIKKKEADQRQLIDFLVTKDPSQVDPETIDIISRFSQYPSITALAKALGLHHEVVKRKLRRLARNYDANRFGDYRDYLIV